VFPVKVWRRRKRPRKLGNKIGRIYHVHPGSGELFFFFPMLLMVVTCATCFKDGVLYSTTFKDAWQARSLSR
jgi:hypothetical protein